MSFDPVTAILNLGSQVIDKIFPDKDAADKAKLEIFKLEQEGKLEELKNTFQNWTKQIEVNIIEASNPSIFVSGWRPFVGWICGIALAYNYIAMPFIVWIVKCFYPNSPEMPILDMFELMTLLFGMLGIAKLRSVDKGKGVASK